MTWVMNLIMFICIVPSTILMFAIGFTDKAGKKKMIFGVRDNPKFHEGEAEQKLKATVKSCRRNALIITTAVCIASIILLFLPVTDTTMTLWMILVFAMLLIAVPFGKGNTELKDLKKELGITKSGLVYTDLTNANVIHSLKLTWLLIPNALALIATIAAVLIDLGIINVNMVCEKYTLTSLSLSFLFIAALIVPIAIMMDNTRNMVISKDSNINANYNRAKKKVWADLIISMSWANALFLVSYLILVMFVKSDIVMLAGILVYTLIILAIVIAGAANQKSIESRYERDTDLDLLDDDDNWILGMFYYNPNDSRLNVEKRLGYGGTVNIAHPAGKAIMIVSAILIFGSLIYIIWAALTGNHFGHQYSRKRFDINVSHSVFSNQFVFPLRYQFFQAPRSICRTCRGKAYASPLYIWEHISLVELICFLSVQKYLTDIRFFEYGSDVVDADITDRGIR